MSKLTVHADQGKQTISRHIYGHFAEHLGRCIYGGIWVGENSHIPNTNGIRNEIIDALKQVKIPNLRWPGGCFADEYHWKDGVGPREDRPEMVNTHWGGVTENNHFGTHEFMELCELLETEPYICGNVGSGTVLEMQQWVEYMTFDGKSPMADWRKENGREKPWKLKYFGVGNENWGCGGHMTAEYYADEYRRYQTYVRNYGDNKIYKIAGGANVDDFHWTEVLMRKAGRLMDGLSLHNYTFPGSWENKGSATDFEEDEWFDTLHHTLHMDTLIRRHSTIMDKYDPQKRVGMIIDEWGTWCDVEPGTNPGFLYQQNTLRDALVAGINLNIFNSHADRVHMANLAQTVNVLQAMILTDEEKVIKTPTYHVFDLYKAHQDATLLPHHLDAPNYTFEKEELPALHVSSSRTEDGTVNVTICNLDPNNAHSLTCDLRGADSPTKVAGTVLTSDKMNDRNTFDNPEQVQPTNFDDITITNDGFSTSIPPKSVVLFEIQ